MRSKFYGIVLALSFFAVNSTGQNQRNPDDKTLLGVRVSRLFPIMDTTGSVNGYDPQYAEIYYHGDKVLYKTPYDFSFHSIDGALIKVEKRFRYLRHDMADLYGYYFDSSLSVVNQKVLLDSMLSREWYGKDFLGPLFENAHTRMTSEVVDNISGTLDQEYMIVGKTDSSQTGSLQLTYSAELTNIPFSFSKAKDNIKGMKLVKAIIINNPRRIGLVEVDRIRQIREIHSISIRDPAALMNYFQ